MGAFIKFLIIYLFVGFVISLVPLIFGKLKEHNRSEKIEWIVYCMCFYPLYGIAMILKGSAIFYEKYVEKLFTK